jgi:hypothetical protein
MGQGVEELYTLEDELRSQKPPGYLPETWGQGTISFT